MYMYLEIIKLLIVLCYGFFTFKTGISPIEASYEYVWCVCVCVYVCVCVCVEIMKMKA